MKICNVCAIVTGGASGLGFATAKILLSYGAKVIICDIKRSPYVDELRGDVIFSETDVTSEESVKRAIEKAEQNFGRINCVINCAGIETTQNLINVSEDKPHDLSLFERVLHVNVIGTFNVIRLTALSMAKNDPGEDGERGVIVNIASITAFEGSIGQSAYASSKAAVVGMTLPVARELAQHGIRCVTVAPGAFRTQMTSMVPDEVMSRLLSKIPFPHRMGEPEEFVDLVKTIIENRMLNGTTIRIDAALRLA
ncbi:hypothetical protein ACTXT7_013470 [Hymenolepis weldensis]